MRSRRLAPILLMALPGCGTHIYRSAGLSALDPGADREVSDDRIRQALESTAQLQTPARVAIYSLDLDRGHALSTALEDVEGVSEIYAIPALLVTGQRRFDEAMPGYIQPEPAPVELAELRLLAAQAGCDLLLVADYGWRRTTRPNGLLSLNVLILPALLAPYLQVEWESYLDTYLLDVRNGHLYSQVTATDDQRRRFVRPFMPREEALLDTQWEQILQDTTQAIAHLLAEA